MSSLSPWEIADTIGVPLHAWKNRCHEISLAVIRHGIVEGRIARGWAKGISSQHSWIATGDPYSMTDTIVDPTWWCWHSAEGPYTFVGTLKMGLHEPHGHGNIWDYGKPQAGDGDPIYLEGLSDEAQLFLDLLGPLDRGGWGVLLNAPVGGWPAKEIILAADKHPALSASIPIDVLGMLSDENVSDIYW